MKRIESLLSDKKHLEKALNWTSNDGVLMIRQKIPVDKKWNETKRNLSLS